MSGPLEDCIKRWAAKRTSGPVIEILQGKTTVAEASRSYDLAPSEIENWVDDARKRMANALIANPLDVRLQYEKRLRDLQEAYGEAMLELRAGKKLQALIVSHWSGCPWERHWSERHRRRSERPWRTEDDN